MEGTSSADRGGNDAEEEANADAELERTQRSVGASILSGELAIGKCLAEALQELQDQDAASQGAEEDEKSSSPLKVNGAVSEAVMNAFRNAIKETTLKKSSHQREELQTGEEDEDDAPPRLLLRGKMEHYNRIGQYWKITVDDVELKNRVPLSRNRRKRNFDDLWDTEAHRNEEVVKLDEKLEILAYNDV